MRLRVGFPAAVDGLALLPVVGISVVETRVHKLGMKKMEVIRRATSQHVILVSRDIVEL